MTRNIFSEIFIICFLIISNALPLDLQKEKKTIPIKDLIPLIEDISCTNYGLIIKAKISDFYPPEAQKDAKINDNMSLYYFFDEFGDLAVSLVSHSKSPDETVTKVF